MKGEDTAAELAFVIRSIDWSESRSLRGGSVSNEAAERLRSALVGIALDPEHAISLHGKLDLALATERKATVAGIEALRHLFFVMERLDRQASEPSSDHFVKITVEAWRDLVTPAIRAVRVILDA